MKLDITYAGPRQLTPEQRLAAERAWIACLQNGVRATVDKIDPAHILNIKELPGFKPEMRVAGAHARLAGISPRIDRDPPEIAAGVIKVVGRLLREEELGHVRIDWDTVSIDTYLPDYQTDQSINMPLGGSPVTEIDFVMRDGSTVVTGAEGVDEGSLRKFMTKSAVPPTSA